MSKIKTINYLATIKKLMMNTKVKRKKNFVNKINNVTVDVVCQQGYQDTVVCIRFQSNRLILRAGK